MKAEVRGQRSEVNSFARDGFAVFEKVISPGQCDALCAELTDLFQTQQASTRNRIGGLRNLLQTSRLVAEVAAGNALKRILRDALGKEGFPVRSIFFDKTPEANWSVAWHQDLHIAVAERIETPGFGPWSVKAGVVHVQPPLEILNRMATVRLHLDDCDSSNGALKVIPGSHAAGVLSDAEVEQWKQREVVICEVPKGGALLMRPLLLHASRAATNPKHRRVLHLEYAIEELPNRLRWFERQ
ncbi:MAG: phytanoyl-CoA dioxygenase [Verrucomicrobia bacterium]|nr:MAG: phytanoyl-CoA dioxygenase [Verrucomicrobiota bacterium]